MAHSLDPSSTRFPMPQPETAIKPRGRGIYLLPNLLTTGCLFSGFYAIIAAIDHNFERAGMAVFAAMNAG